MMSKMNEPSFNEEFPSPPAPLPHAGEGCN